MAMKKSKDVLPEKPYDIVMAFARGETVVIENVKVRKSDRGGMRADIPQGMGAEAFTSWEKRNADVIAKLREHTDRVIAAKKADKREAESDSREPETNVEPDND